MIDRVLREYYLLAAIRTAGIGLTAAMYVNFLRAHGLNFLEMSFVNASFFITLFLCEIPTGAFADVYGRKASYVVACILTTIGMAVYGCSQTMPGFMCAEMILAVGMTFESGAFNAWFIDRLAHHGHDANDRILIFARRDQLVNVITIIAGIIGGYLTAVNNQWPWLLGSVIAGSSIIVVLRIPEEYRAPRGLSFKRDLKLMLECVRNGGYLMLSVRGLRFLLLSVMVHVALMQSLNMYWQPFFDPNLQYEHLMGYLFAGIALSVMLGSILAPRLLKKWYAPEKIIIYSQVFTGVCIILCALTSNSWLALLLFLIHEVGRGIRGPITSVYLHEHARSEERATAESFGSIAHHLGGACGLIASGAIANTLGIAPTWMICGIVLIISSLIILRYWIKR